jgi:transcriptional adapter 3
VPELGRHYTEQWEDEDIAFYGGVPVSLDFTNSRHASATSSNHVPGGSPPIPLQKWDPSTLGELDLASEKGLGPLTERIASSFLSTANQASRAAWKSVKEAEEAYEAKTAAEANGAGVGSVSTNGSIIPKERIYVADFEERLKESLRFHGILQSDVSSSPSSSFQRNSERATNSKK